MVNLVNGRLGERGEGPFHLTDDFTDRNRVDGSCFKILSIVALFLILKDSHHQVEMDRLKTENTLLHYRYRNCSSSVKESSLAIANGEEDCAMWNKKLKKWEGRLKQADREHQMWVENVQLIRDHFYPGFCGEERRGNMTKISDRTPLIKAAKRAKEAEEQRSKTRAKYEAIKQHRPPFCKPHSQFKQIAR